MRPGEAKGTALCVRLCPTRGGGTGSGLSDVEGRWEHNGPSVFSIENLVILGWQQGLGYSQQQLLL